MDDVEFFGLLGAFRSQLGLLAGGQLSFFVQKVLHIQQLPLEQLFVQFELPVDGQQCVCQLISGAVDGLLLRGGVSLHAGGLKSKVKMINE